VRPVSVLTLLRSSGAAERVFRTGAARFGRQKPGLLRLGPPRCSSRRAGVEVDQPNRRVSLARARKVADYSNVLIGEPSLFEGVDELLKVLRDGSVIAAGLCMAHCELQGVQDIPSDFWIAYSPTEFAEVAEFETAHGKRDGADVSYFFPTIAADDLILALWAIKQSAAERATQSRIARLPIRRGGRPLKYDWHSIWMVTCRALHFEGIPETVAGMVELMQAACRRNMIDEPDEETLRPLARRLLNHLRAEEDSGTPAADLARSSNRF
jgi:hypothetical protein